MLQNIRDKSTGWITKIVIGFIVLTFALFGVESLISLANREPAPATVNGDDIKQQDLSQMVELQRRQIYNQLGGNVDPAMLEENRLKSQALDRLIDEKLLLQEAAKRHLTVPDMMVDQMIVQTPDFQDNGKFSQERYQQVLGNNGMTPLMYRQLLQKQLLIGQLRDAIVGSSFMLPSEFDQLMALDRQQRDIRYSEFKVSDFLDKATPSDADLKSYYDAHLKTYEAPEQVAVNYIELSKDNFVGLAKVDEAALQTDYDAAVEKLKAQKAREVAHILIAVNDKRDDAAAKARADEVEAKLKSGEDFSALAKTYSDDSGSANDGGNLGFLEPGTLGDSLDKAVEALQVGQVSEPVRSDYGYHIVKLVSVQDKTPPSFDDMKASLVKQQKDSKAEQLFLEKAEQLADLVFTSSDLEAPAKTLGVEVKQVPLFSRNTAEGVVANEKVLAKAFDPDFINDGANSDPIEVGKDHVVVIRVTDHKESRQLTLDEVKDRVTEAVKRRQAHDLAVKAADALKAEMLKQPDGMSAWQQKDNLTRNAQEDPLLVRGIFAMPKPEEGKPSIEPITLMSGDVWLVDLAKVHAGEQKVSDEQRQGLASYLAGQEGSQLFQAFLEKLRTSAAIERH